MKGFVILLKEESELRETMGSWIFVPERQVKFNAMRNGIGEMIVASFYTNVPRAPTIVDFDFLHGCKLQESHHFSEELDVPDEIVEFAVANVEERHREIESIAEILQRSMKKGDADSGFTEFLQLGETTKLFDEETIGLRTMEFIEANKPTQKMN